MLFLGLALVVLFLIAFLFFGIYAVGLILMILGFCLGIVGAIILIRKAFMKASTDDDYHHKEALDKRGSLVLLGGILLVCLGDTLTGLVH